jgi:anthranilate phosphoribosyltransferase
MALLDFLPLVADRTSLSLEQAEKAMTSILSGEATTAQIAGFLVALRMKGETVDELAGFARAMRAHASPVPFDAGAEPLVDTCGTGGDGTGTFNISTVAAFVVAGAGLRVAKHGNRSASSRCGSADLFEALGVNIALTPAQMAECLREVGMAFLFAPALHPAMKHAAPARSELKLRTAFNLLGPLTNPARATHQLIGAPSELAAELMARTLARLPIRRAMVVHGSDGLDEITTTGLTVAFDVEDGRVRQRHILPAEFGVPVAGRGALAGADREANRDIALAILAGEGGAPRDIVIVNAAAALWLAGQADSFNAAASLASQSINSGAAREKLRQLAAFSQRCAA